MSIKSGDFIESPRVRSLIFIAFFLAMAACIHNAHLEIRNQLFFDKTTWWQNRAIPASDVVKPYTLGFDRLVADLYWLEFVQYYGDKDACVVDKYSKAPAYLNLVTRLDPHFVQPFWFASFILRAELGLKREARELLDWGVKENPDNWKLPYIAGFNAYLYDKDEKKAAAYYRMAAARKDAPDWLARQASILEEKIPSQVKKIRTWQQLYNSSEGLVKEKARDTLIGLWSRIYYDAPTPAIKDRAMSQLKELDAEPLPKHKLPPVEE